MYCYQEGNALLIKAVEELCHTLSYFSPKQRVPFEITTQPNEPFHATKRHWACEGALLLAMAKCQRRTSRVHTCAAATFPITSWAAASSSCSRFVVDRAGLLVAIVGCSCLATTVPGWGCPLPVMDSTSPCTIICREM